MDRGSEDSGTSMGGEPDATYVTCPRCYQLNSADAETCKRCRFDFTIRDRSARWASTLEPERRQVKINLSGERVSGGLPKSEYQVLRNERAAVTVKRILPLSQTQLQITTLTGITIGIVILAFLLLRVLGLVRLSSLAAMIAVIGLLVLLALIAIARGYLQRVSKQFRESNSEAIGTVVVRRADRYEDDYGKVHSKCYLIIEFDAGDRIVWLETAVKESVYNSHLLEARISVRYCTTDPRIALVGKETTWDI